MGHYAFINSDNIVTEVITGRDEGDSGIDWEQHYAEFRPGQRCRRTSYNTQSGAHVLGGVPFRKNYAGIGYTWDADRDAFVPPRAYASWTLDEETCRWVPPHPEPQDGKMHDWDESTLSWVEVVMPTVG